MLTVKEVAERLQVSDRTVRNWIKDGYLVPYRFGKLYKFKESDIEDFINNNKLNKKGD